MSSGGRCSVVCGQRCRASDHFVCKIERLLAGSGDRGCVCAPEDSVKPLLLMDVSKATYNPCVSIEKGVHC